LLGPLPGIVLAVLVTAVDVARRAAAMPWVELGGAPADVATERYATAGGGEVRPGLLLLRPEGPLFYANADASRQVLETSADDPGVRWVVLDLEAVSDIDPTASEALADGLATAATSGTTVAISRARKPIQELLERYGLIEVVGKDRVFGSNRAAVEAYDRSAPAVVAAPEVTGAARATNRPDERTPGPTRVDADRGHPPGDEPQVADLTASETAAGGRDLPRDEPGGTP
jgi:sulfate permease, SulP family